MDSQIEIIKLPVKVFYKKNHGSMYPCLEIRKNFQDYDIITKIIESIYNNQPILFLPTFSDKLKALNKLVEMGIVEQKFDENNNVFFNIVELK